MFCFQSLLHISEASQPKAGVIYLVRSILLTISFFISLDFFNAFSILCFLSRPGPSSSCNRVISSPFSFAICSMAALSTTWWNALAGTGGKDVI